MSDNSVGPRWLDIARQYIGIKEISGVRHDPTVVGWWKKIGLAFRDDETPWCAGFVGGVLEEAGIRSTRSGMARSYLKLGLELKKPAVGAIVVFWRGSKKSSSGHVGFVVGKDKKGNLMVLGGNQGDAVTIAAFSKDRVLGYRWPGIAPFAYRYDLPVLKSDGTVSTNEQ